MREDAPGRLGYLGNLWAERGLRVSAHALLGSPAGRQSPRKGFGEAATGGLTTAPLGV
ncbi:hypothetical protein C7438_1205 [Brockia lithotrophica]|uniref:Uncharacterized protein n=1 Tax=Brockia lithotrophica TaxID=933949 RepID=A0A660KW88_9BACL|nr:hypothetical protein C7438_1205 [Brockia lithotrophica]